MSYDVVRLVYYGSIITSFGKSTNLQMGKWANLRMGEWANGE